MTYLRQIPLARKFIIVILLTMVPTIVLLHSFSKIETQRIASTEKKIESIDHIALLRELMQTIAEHRGISNGFLKGATELKPRLVEKVAKIETIMGSVETLQMTDWTPFDYKSERDGIRSDWSKLQRDYVNLQPSVSFSRHTQLIATIKSYMDLVSTGSGLMLNSDLASASLVNALTDTLPLFAETMGQARGVAAGVAANGAAKTEAKTQLITKLSRINDLSRSLAGYYKLAFDAMPEMEVVVGSRVEQLIKASTQYANKIDSNIIQASDIQVSSGEIFDAGSIVIKISVKLWNDTLPILTEVFNDRREHLWKEVLFTICITGITIIATLLAAIYILRDVIKRIGAGVEALTKIENGNFDTEIHSVGNDEPARLLNALDTMQTRLAKRIDSDASAAAETLRIKMALENCATAKIMVLDSDLSIVYINPALQGLLSASGSRIQKEYPKFKNERLLGVPFSVFDKPGEGTALSQQVRNLKGTQSWDLCADGLTFSLTAAPVVNNGEHTSTVIEWSDLTMEIAIETEVQEVVDAAKDGNMKERINLQNKSEFFVHLGSSVNQLMDSSEHIINETVRVLGAVSTGNLSSKINGDFNGVFERLQMNVNETVEKLTEVSGEMKRSADSVAEGSQSINKGNEELARRTSQQQSSLVQTTESMDQITGAVKLTADNAQNADKLAASAGAHAEKGTQVMGQVEGAMEEINNSSKKISAITGVIDDIAFQTNLLALNASVEAARAGEQGRGFAVVASEVRNLAGRSAEAAKEIKELIEESVKKIEDGSTMVDRSGKSLNEIVTSVNQVTDIVAEIATASREQSRGIEQVNRALNEMDNATKENSDLVKHVANASRDMGAEAKELKERVAFFHAGKVEAIPFQKAA